MCIGKTSLIQDTWPWLTIDICSVFRRLNRTLFRRPWPWRDPSYRNPEILCWWHRWLSVWDLRACHVVISGQVTTSTGRTRHSTLLKSTLLSVMHSIFIKERTQMLSSGDHDICLVWGPCVQKTGFRLRISSQNITALNHTFNLFCRDRITWTSTLEIWHG